MRESGVREVENLSRVPGDACRSPTEKTVIETRIALPNDVDVIRTIRHRSFATLRDTYTPNADTQSSDSKRSDSMGTRARYEIIAAVVDEFAGVVSATIDGSALRLSGLAVLPEFRRRGIARSLIDHAWRVAVDTNCESLRLFTIRETGNVEIFKQLGFSAVGESLADWCSSDRFNALHETEMERRFGEHNKA